MARYNSPFAPQSGYAANASANMMNLAQAGSRVMAPDLANLASNTPHVNRNLIPILLEAPRFFRYTSQNAQLVRSLKALIENHVRTIDGLQQGITADMSEVQVGGSGETISVATNVTRAQSRPSMGCWELNGRAIQHFLKFWITYGMADENTKVPRIVSDGIVKPENWSQTFAGMTCIFIEPDATFQDVVSAYLCTDMKPTSTGPWEGRKDASQIGQTLDLSIEFTALTDVSEGTKMYARQLLQQMQLGGLNPAETRTWMENISADVLAARVGITDQLQEAANNRVTYN